MSVKPLLLVVLVAQLVAVVCATGIAQASATMTQPQRVRFERAMAGYARTLASTTVAEATAQMTAEEARIAPCVAVLKAGYASGFGLGPTSEASEPLPKGPAPSVDLILGDGAHDTGEQWAAAAELPLARLLMQGMYFANVKASLHVNVCTAVRQWSAQAYYWRDRPRIGNVLASYPSASPVAAFGARYSARTFTAFGFSRGSARRLLADLNRGLARYQTLNAATGSQFSAWLQQEGVYQVMQSGDRREAFAIY